MTNVDRLPAVGEGLIGLLSHDLRAPLGPMSLATSFLSSEAATQEDVRELARIADVQGDKVRRLIESALAASGRRPRARMEPACLTDVLGAAEQAFAALGGTVDASVDDVALVCDRTLLRDAFVNLMECAVGEGGAARVDVRVEDATVKAVLACRDVAALGVSLHAGIPQDAPASFLLGSRVFVEMHGGTLELTDEGLIVWIPLIPAE